MKILLGSDHRGFALKEEIKSWLVENGHDVKDCGNTKLDPADDYPDYASRVASGLKNESKEARGILLCSSGVGVDIVANKFDGIRSGVAISVDQIRSACADDNINVLSIASDYFLVDESKELIETFLNTEFKAEEKHIRRLDKIETIESTN